MSSLGPFGGCAHTHPGCIHSEALQSVSATAFLLIEGASLWTTCACVWFPWIRNVKQFFLQEEPMLFFPECVSSRFLSFSSSSVCCQDPGRFGRAWLKWVDGALQGSTDSFAREPDHQGGRKFGAGHSTDSLKEKEANLKVLCSLKFCEVMGQTQLCWGKKMTKLQGGP